MPPHLHLLVKSKKSSRDLQVFLPEHPACTTKDNAEFLFATDEVTRLP